MFSLACKPTRAERRRSSAAILLFVILVLADVTHANPRLRPISSLLLTPHPSLLVARARSSAAIQSQALSSRASSPRTIITGTSAHWRGTIQANARSISSLASATLHRVIHYPPHTRGSFTAFFDSPRLPDSRIVFLANDDLFLADINAWLGITEISPGGSPVDLVQNGQLVRQNVPFAEAPFNRIVVPAESAPYVLDIVAHGNRFGIAVNTESSGYRLTSDAQATDAQVRDKKIRMGPYDFARFIRHHPVYQEALCRAGSRLVIRLIVCCVGSQPYAHSFANILCRLLQCSVFAPDDVLWFGSPPVPARDLTVSPDNLAELKRLELVSQAKQGHWIFIKRY